MSGFKKGALEIVSSDDSVVIKHIKTINIKIIDYQMDLDIIFSKRLKKDLTRIIKVKFEL